MNTINPRESKQNKALVEVNKTTHESDAMWDEIMQQLEPISDSGSDEAFRRITDRVIKERPDETLRGQRFEQGGQ